MHVQQRLIKIRRCRLSPRRKREMMIKIVRFLQLAAIQQQDSVPDRLRPEMSRLLIRENRFFPVSLFTDRKNETHHGKPSAYKPFPDIVLVRRVLYFGKNLSGILLNFIAESAVIVSRLFIGVSRAH